VTLVIISASRRTDIPALYTKWLLNRLEAGFCVVRNPFNPKQESLVSLNPEDVEVIVFWTKDPRPLMAHLDYLDQKGYRYYFQYTLTGYPHYLEPGAPSLDQAIETFSQLADRLGAIRVVWRYDPIIISDATGFSYHLEAFGQIAQALKGSTQRVVISLWDAYEKSRRRMREVADKTGSLQENLEVCEEQQRAFFSDLASIARQCEMNISSCSESGLESYGIAKGKCIDDELVRQVFGIEVSSAKNPGQRQECGCIASKDIGAYDTCILGCKYCYGVTSPSLALARYRQHDPLAPCLAAPFAH
jgi:DNA repair photolyase